MVSGNDVTELLGKCREGDARAFERLIPIVYGDLRRIARAQLLRAPSGNTLQTTGLVNEAYLRLVDQTSATWEDRQHFLCVCAKAMRQIAISNARRHAAEKRGGGAREQTWEDGLAQVPERPERLLELNEALDRLAKQDERLVRVVECRFFVGFTEEETAEALGSSLRTVQRDWKRARAWLLDEMKEPFDS